MNRREQRSSQTRPFKRVEFLVVDVETTGLSTADDLILQIGAVVTNAQGKVKRTFSTYVRPGTGGAFPWGNQEPPAHHIHGITNEQLRKGTSTKRALRRLRRLSRNRVLVAHNAKFDYGFIKSESARQGLAVSVDTHLCTLELSRRLDPKRAESHRLGSLCERYNIPLSQAHDALCDATATAQLLAILIKSHGATSVEQLYQLAK